MSVRSIRRTATALASAGALLMVALVAAAPAGAARIHVCVRERSGAMRLVSRSAKCRKGEFRLSWNTSGPPGTTGPKGANGANGANGADGANGANGAVAGYMASGSNEVPLGATDKTIGTKALPPGNYLVSGKVEVITEAANPGFTGLRCQLLDGAVLDTSYSDTPLAELKGKFFSIVTLPLLAVLNTTAPSTLSVSCSVFYNTGEGAVRAEKWALTAVQTTKNS